VDNSTNQPTKPCTGKHYCGHWRTCDRCARIRAARFADRAEYLEHRLGRLALAVAKPAANTATAIKHLRDKLVRAKLAPAGLWTIETGELYAGLHLNLLIPSEHLIRAETKVDYIETVRTSSRAAAAYICKRAGMPSSEQYNGRLQGEWGTVMQHLMNGTSLQAAPSQAAALQMALSAKRSIADFYKTDAELEALVIQSHAASKEKTRDEYAAIMRRNLAAVYLALNNRPQGNAP
jgi:hypothetical protein